MRKTEEEEDCSNDKDDNGEGAEKNFINKDIDIDAK